MIPRFRSWRDAAQMLADIQTLTTAPSDEVMSIFSASDEGEKSDIVPNRWVRFTRAWAWNIPQYGGRATKHFPAGTEIRLTRAQFQSAMSAGVAVSIPNPRHARSQEADNG